MIKIGRTIDVEHLKDEIRKLNRIDKNEICRWIDEEAAIGLLFRIGMPGNRTEAESHPKRHEHLSPPP